MTGIIGAMNIEVNGLISEMENPVTETISTMRFTSGKIGGHDVVVAKCGVGKVNAAVCAQTMILRYHPDRIINTGIAGSTSAKTHIGSVVIADRAVQHDMNTEVIGDERGTLFLEDESIMYIPCDSTLSGEIADVCRRLGDIDYTVGTVATGDIFIGSNDAREKLMRKFGAIACEMEGGSIGHVCYINRVPFCILRSISDDGTSDDPGVEYSTFSRSAADKAVRILLTYLS